MYIIFRTVVVIVVFRSFLNLDFTAKKILSSVSFIRNLQFNGNFLLKSKRKNSSPHTITQFFFFFHIAISKSDFFVSTKSWTFIFCCPWRILCMVRGVESLHTLHKQINIGKIGKSYAISMTVRSIFYSCYSSALFSARNNKQFVILAITESFFSSFWVIMRSPIKVVDLLYMVVDSRLSKRFLERAST